jgi:aspartate 1-decarboxylase
VPDDQVRNHQPKLVSMDDSNRIKEERVPVQAALSEAIPL